MLERYELLYEAGLIHERWRDLALTPPPEDAAVFGLPMAADHRRILATAIGRLRGKIKYRPVVFELMPPGFTFLQLQRTVEALAGVRLHKSMMRSQWSDIDAERLVKHYAGEGIGRDLALRVYTSRLLGRDPKLVLHGGGNTSVKTVVKDLLGDEPEVLCVKGAAGTWPRSSPPGCRPCGLRPCTNCEGAQPCRTTKWCAARQIRPPGVLNPSVETLLHAFLPHKYVDHTHSTAVLSLADQPDAAERCADLYGSRLGLAPYIMPGFLLAKAAAEIFEADPAVEGLGVVETRYLHLRRDRTTGLRTHGRRGFSGQERLSRRRGHAVQLIDFQVEDHRAYFRMLEGWQPGMSWRFRDITWRTSPKSSTSQRRQRRGFPRFLSWSAGTARRSRQRRRSRTARVPSTACSKARARRGCRCCWRRSRLGRDPATVPGAVTADAEGPAGTVHSLDDFAPARNLLRHRREYFLGTLDPCAQRPPVLTRLPVGLLVLQCLDILRPQLSAGQPERAVEDLQQLIPASRASSSSMMSLSFRNGTGWRWAKRSPSGIERDITSKRAAMRCCATKTCSDSARSRPRRHVHRV